MPTEPVPPPRRISNRVLSLKITGYVSPFLASGQPCLVAVEGTEDLFVAVFSTLAKLRAFSAGAKGALSYDKTVMVTDGPEFASTLLEQGVRIMVDPYTHESGRLRWVEVLAIEPGESS